MLESQTWFMPSSPNELSLPLSAFDVCAPFWVLSLLPVLPEGVASVDLQEKQIIQALDVCYLQINSRRESLLADNSSAAKRQQSCATVSALPGWSEEAP